MSGSFLQTYGPLASQAGSTLGVDPSVILGQWALESGNGTNSLTLNNNNPGAIMPGGNAASYSSPQQFEQAYVNTIQSDFPGAVNTGSNILAFTDALGSGVNGSYYGTTSPASYASGIAAEQAAMTNAAGGGLASSPYTASGSLGANSTAPASTSPTGGCSGITSFLTWGCWSGIFLDATFIAFGAVMIFLSVAGAMKGPVAMIQAAKIE